MQPARREGAEDNDEHRREVALVTAMLGGDERAMEEFADAYFPSLYRFALGRLGGNTDLARDLVQSTVVKALSKLATFRGEASLSTWLCACCRNEIAMHFRREKRFPWMVELDAEGGEEVAAPLAGGGPEPEARLVQREEARQVHATLDGLPPRYARALEWKYLERLSVEEIAARLALGVKAAESLLSRARSAFRGGYQSLTRGLPAAPVVSMSKRG